MKFDYQGVGHTDETERSEGGNGGCLCMIMTVVLVGFLKTSRTKQIQAII